MSAPIKLPASPLVPPEARQAIAVLNALANLELVIVDASGVEHKGRIEIVGDSSVLRIRLS